jgi:hypothetical protein
MRAGIQSKSTKLSNAVIAMSVAKKQSKITLAAIYKGAKHQCYCPKTSVIIVNLRAYPQTRILPSRFTMARTLGISRSHKSRGILTTPTAKNSAQVDILALCS